MGTSKGHCAKGKRNVNKAAGTLREEISIGMAFSHLQFVCFGSESVEFVNLERFPPWFGLVSHLENPSIITNHARTFRPLIDRMCLGLGWQLLWNPLQF